MPESRTPEQWEAEHRRQAMERHGYPSDFDYFCAEQFAEQRGSHVTILPMANAHGFTPQQAYALARRLIALAKQANREIPEELRFPIDFGMPTHCEKCRAEMASPPEPELIDNQEIEAAELAIRGLVTCPECGELFRRPDGLGILCLRCQWGVDNPEEE